MTHQGHATEPASSSLRSLVFAPDVASAPPPDPAVRVVVLDATWTRGPDDRHDLVPVRALFGLVVEAADLYDDALALVDDWADRTGAADTLLVEGVTYWFRMRETMWRWLHERMLWRRTIGALELPADPAQVVVPEDEGALRDVLEAMWPGRVVVVDGAGRTVTAGEPGAPPPEVAARRPPTAGAIAVAARVLRALVRRGRRLLVRGQRTPGSEPAGVATERARRDAVLDARIRAVVARSGPRALVLTNPRTYHRIGLEDVHADPLFGALIPRLGEAGLEPVLFGSYVDHRTDDGWAIAASDERMLPQSLLQTRWRGTDDEPRADRATAAIGQALGALAGSRLEVDGVDLGPAFVAELDARLHRAVRIDVPMLARIERLLAELRPSVVLLAQEGIRTPWLMACRRAGIPVIAVQHGVLYPTHPGYPHRRHAALVQPTVTAVYGSYEASVLLDRGAYRPDQVAVTGSPRVDLDAPDTTAPDDQADAERIAVRRELGVADGDRLVVISTVNLPFIQRSHFSHSVAAILGGPLPRVHVVFKQHPGETEAGPYRALVEGLAIAAGRTAPPITVVKDVDLYRLLRAADAHLGMLSTVLTDAVVAGTKNLIGVVDRHADLIGYRDAGVAFPVRDTAGFLAELDRPWVLDRARRAAFLELHARPGDATGRILEIVRDAIGVRAS
jgi:hypothetical protein